ncbi:MAG TPA: RNA-guided endonuclease TnpB family protein [Leptospiraceae bacterium]|nr:RNA-guided endonuclease TnpB family protein [Leptospiraceae bacterium]
MLKGIKVKLYPTKNQEIYINNLLGSYRFVYNKCLEKKIEEYTLNNKSFGLKDLGVYFHQHLTKTEDFNFLTAHNTHVLKQALIDLLDAYKRFFVNGSGFPKFKSKKNIQSCRFPSTALATKLFTNNRINLVKQLKGLKFRCSTTEKESLLNKRNKIKSATLSKEKSGEFWISFLIDLPSEVLPEPKYESIGLDFGIKDFITTSRNEKITNLKTVRNNKKNLKRLNQNLSRKVKGSKNRKKAQIKLAKAYKKLTNKKNTYIHTITKKIVQENSLVGIEDLNISGMMKNQNLAKSIAELSIYETSRQLEYKSKWYGRDIVRIDKFYPSSKLCSNCGWKNEILQLSDREWVCKECGAFHDRDENAAKNIEKEALRLFNLTKQVGSCCSEFKPVDSALMDDRKLKTFS